MMTREQIAERIQEELRKHGKNDPEGWPLIAAGKIRAEMQYPVAGPKYWFYTLHEKSVSPHIEWPWEPTHGVSQEHPFVILSKRRAAMKVTWVRLGFWCPITQAEYEMWRQLP